MEDIPDTLTDVTQIDHVIALLVVEKQTLQTRITKLRGMRRRAAKLLKDYAALGQD